MQAKKFTSAVAVVALSGTCAFASQAVNAADNNPEHKWMPKQPVDRYWQAPNFNFTSPDRSAPQAYTPPPRPMPPVNNNAYRPPIAPPPARHTTRTPAPAYRPPYPAAPGMNRPNTNRPEKNMAPARQNPNRGFPPPPRGAYYGPDNGASAYNMPGYNPNRNYRRNNRWDNNKFWGRSGPSTWMSPGKRNWENSWDDMMNAPSRMGEMPGGWTAPEVTVPNPVDMGDQMQDNVKDLPEQIKDMDVDN